MKDLFKVKRLQLKRSNQKSRYSESKKVCRYVVEGM